MNPIIPFMDEKLLQYRDDPTSLKLEDIPVLIESLRLARDDLSAGKELVRQAWGELNAIRARQGSPEGCMRESFSALVDALSNLLGNDSVPWMTGAARELIERHRERNI